MLQDMIQDKLGMLHGSVREDVWIILSCLQKGCMPDVSSVDAHDLFSDPSTWRYSPNKSSQVQNNHRLADDSFHLVNCAPLIHRR